MRRNMQSMSDFGGGRRRTENQGQNPGMRMSAQSIQYLHAIEIRQVEIKDQQIDRQDQWLGGLSRTISTFVGHRLRQERSQTLMSARIERYLMTRILEHRGAQLRNASIVFKQTYLSHSVITFFVLLTHTSHKL